MCDSPEGEASQLITLRITTQPLKNDRRSMIDQQFLIEDLTASLPQGPNTLPQVFVASRKCSSQAATLQQVFADSRMLAATSL